MPNAIQQAGGLTEPSSFAPLHTNRIFTGLWTNRSLMRDAATTDYQEAYGMGRRDSILGGFNSEISSKLTLRRRYGSSVYNPTVIPPVKRFYSFNTFTLTDELIRVMADTAATVYDVTGGTATAIFTKSPAADPKNGTYFLSVGNTLYFTNGVDNMQVTYDPATGTWGTVSNWGIAAPTVAPTVTQQAKPNTYPQWEAQTVFSPGGANALTIEELHVDSLQQVTTFGMTGTAEPTWTIPTTTDGTVIWTRQAGGNSGWAASFAYALDTPVIGTVIDPKTGLNIATLFRCSQAGTSQATPPSWVPGIGSLTSDGPNLIWKNQGNLLYWADIGATTTILNAPTIVDTNGYLQTVAQPGKTGVAPPQVWQTVTGAYTTDGTVIWLNQGPFAVAATAGAQYGYAYMNSKTDDISNMSPASIQITVTKGGQVVIQGPGSADPQVDTVIIFRTAQGGSTFLYLDQVPNPGAGKTWTYTDSLPDSELNTEWQAQVGGEGTPLPAGATCLGYHLGRIFAAVGNVVWVSFGPDATVGGSSGNAGFDVQLVAQSKIIRFWACSLGMVVFTVRDAYIILGSATDTDPLYMVVFIENLPLRSYDCFTVNKTTPYMLMGNNQLVALDPSAGIIEAGFPIADRLEEEYDSSASYVTFHTQTSRENALYIGNGGVSGGGTKAPATGQWYRMAQNNAPEQGSAWSTKATLAGLNMGCVQSVEVTPGVYRLLISGTAAGPIWQRDLTKNTDNGNKFAVQTVLGNIVLALPGQLAALSFITLESVKTGTRAGLALLLGELSGTFEALKRTRQDPPILPPSNTLFSDRYHFAQNQSEAWCRHFQMELTWPAEDAPNELLTFTIFGQTWQEMRSQ